MRSENLQLTLCVADMSTQVSLPFADEGVRAGFPSPTQGYLDNAIDLNRDLILHPESTFYARVSGDSMLDAYLVEGDILVVDRSLEAQDGDIVICVVEGDFTVKFLELREDGVVLRPANPAYPLLHLHPSDDFEVWGVVTYVIHATRVHR